MENIFNLPPTGALVCKAWCSMITENQGLVDHVQRERREEEERFVVGYASPRSYGSDW